MHITKTLTALAIAASVLAAAPSADAARNSLGVTGSGTWTPAATGVSAGGTSKGTPVAGQTLITIAPTDGSLPTHGVCEPVTGTVEITSKTAALELDIAAMSRRRTATAVDRFSRIRVRPVRTRRSPAGRRAKPGAAASVVWRHSSRNLPR